MVFPYNNILVLPSGKGLQSVDYSYCDLDQRICSSPLPGHLMCSDTVDIIHFYSFLGSWFCHCLLQASCIASCHCAEYCSPYHRCIILSLHLRRHSILRHDFQALNIRCKRKLFYQRAKVLWLNAGSRLCLRLNRLKSCQLLFKAIVGLCRRLRKLNVKDHYRDLHALFGTAGSGAVLSTPESHKTPGRRVGGRSMSKAYLFSQISDHLVPGSMEAGTDFMYRYVAHVDACISFPTICSHKCTAR